MRSATRSCRGEGPLPCIWVLAGVLSYRLCDRAYECEGCELFHALSGGGSRPGSRKSTAPQSAREFGREATIAWREEQVASHLHHVLRDCPLYLDRYYRPPHFWLETGKDDDLTVGLAGHLLRILHPIDRIVTPDVGLRLDRDQPCGWIARRGMAIPLLMPVSGVVRAVNEAACGDRAGQETGSDDWLFRLQPSEALESVAGLLRGEEMLLWHLDNIRTLKSYLREAVASPSEEALGPLLADGGVRQPGLEDVLGTSRFRELVEAIA